MHSLASSRSKTKLEYELLDGARLAPRWDAAARRCGCPTLRTRLHSDPGLEFCRGHPVAFRFVMKAKERGATIVHVDPRFTRTSAMADVYAPIRSGTDIVFLGAIVNYVLSNDLYFKEYVAVYTNAAHVVNESYRGAEDLDGLFSGYDRRSAATTCRLGLRKRRRRTRRVGSGAAAPALRPQRPAPALRSLHAGDGRARVRDAEGDVAEDRRAIVRNSGRERTTAFAYAVG